MVVCTGFSAASRYIQCLMNCSSPVDADMDAEADTQYHRTRRFTRHARSSPWAIKEYTTRRKTLQDIPLETIDLLQPVSMPQLPPSLDEGVVGVRSTIVLGHIPLAQFFAAAFAIMTPGRYLLVTDMHADMRMRSQAEFTDPANGVKIRPTTYCHMLFPKLCRQPGRQIFSIEDIAGANSKEYSNGGLGYGVLVQGIDESLDGSVPGRRNGWGQGLVWSVFQEGKVVR